MKILTSRDNPRLKAIARLNASARARDEAGLTVLDGVHLIETWLHHVGPPQTVLVADDACRKTEIASLLDQLTEAHGSEILQLPARLLQSLASVETASGILAVIAIPEPLPIDPAADCLLLDGIQDPGNVGSILRSAAAAGFAQILLSSDCAKAWSPKVLRAAMGAHAFLRIHENIDLAEWLKHYPGKAAVTSLQAETSLYEADLCQPLAFIFGSEGQGVREEILCRASTHLLIPMLGGVESLNVGSAAAICLFEAVRQRGANRKQEQG